MKTKQTPPKDRIRIIHLIGERWQLEINGVKSHPEKEKEPIIFNGYVLWWDVWTDSKLWKVKVAKLSEPLSYIELDETLC